MNCFNSSAKTFKYSFDIATLILASALVLTLIWLAGSGGLRLLFATPLTKLLLNTSQVMLAGWPYGLALLGGGGVGWRRWLASTRAAMSSMSQRRTASSMKARISG